MKAIADALNMSVDARLAQAGVVLSHPQDAPARPSTESVIRNDPRLSATQKSALLAVLGSMVTEPEAGTG